jgi:hypothetical protein
MGGHIPFIQSSASVSPAVFGPAFLSSLFLPQVKLQGALVEPDIRLGCRNLSPELIGQGMGVGKQGGVEAKAKKTS